MANELLERLAALMREWVESPGAKTFEDCRMLMERRDEIFRELESAGGRPGRAAPDQLAVIQALDRIVLERFRELKEQAAAELDKLAATRKLQRAYDSSNPVQTSLFYESWH